jgi:branched-chain amino acid aminotransferase
MSLVYPKIFFGDRLVDKSEASLSVTSSAVLYGLSIYTVFYVKKSDVGYAAFRFEDHWRRLTDSAKIVGFNQFEKIWTYPKFKSAVKKLLSENRPSTDVFIRASVHLNAELPGPRTRDLPLTLSLFAYEARSILPSEGTRLKTSSWRRISDQAIPARAKINGAYVNSALAKQEALNEGYDDCIILDDRGHISELSAANIFIVRHGKLITPGVESDNLEGINRRTIIQLAEEAGIKVEERSIDLTELYIADEAFACGTSVFVTPVVEIDGREIGQKRGELTDLLRRQHQLCLSGKNHPEWSMGF